MLTASHSWTVASAEPDTIRVPSGLNATLVTCLLLPLIGSPIGCPVAVSHSRIVESIEPEAIREPSGLNATLVTALS
jgi:hypothetical protein